jgi:hypothetical protein
MRASPSPWKKPFGPITIWCALGLLALVSLGIDFANVKQGGAIDLRNRITGERLLAHGIDPYFYKWQEPESPEYCDPYNNPLLPVSKTTATPALLALHLPLAVLPYRVVQFAWLALQWLFLLATTGLWLRRCEFPWQRRWLAAFVVGFTYTAAWRLHAERGQSYVLLLFLFALWLAGTLKAGGEKSFWTGLLAGFLVALRPPFLLLMPFILLHRRGQWLGAVVGLALGIVVPLFWQTNTWSHYASAMQAHSELYRTGTDPAPPPERFPPEIENIPTDLLANYVAIPYADFSVHALLRGLGLEPFPSWAPLLVVAAAYGAWLWWSRAQGIGPLLLGVAAWSFIVDLFLPAYRDNYNDVLILNVVALGLIAFPRAPWGGWCCTAALPVGWLIYLTAPMNDLLIDLPSFFLALGAVLLLFEFNSPANRRKVAKVC